MRIMVDIVVNHAGYGTESTFADMLRDKSVSEGDIKSWQSGLPVLQQRMQSQSKISRMADCMDDGLWS